MQSVYKPEYCDMLVEHMKDGNGLTSFGAKINVGRSTLYYWIDNKQDFADAFELGKAHLDWYLDQVGKAGMMGKVKNFVPSIYIFHRKNHSGWTDKQEVKTNITGNGAKLIIQMGDDE